MRNRLWVVLLIVALSVQGCYTYTPDQLPSIQHIPTSAYNEAIYAGCVRAMARITLHLQITEEITSNWIYNYCAEIVKSFENDRIKPSIMNGI